MNDKVKEQNKMQFISQYFGQRIWNIGLMQPKLINGYSLMKYIGLEESHLLLRSINYLTDEECEFIAPYFLLKVCRYLKSNIIKVLEGDMSTLYFERENIIIVNDILKSIGIALPFTYLNDQNQPETYSVEKLVQLGWVKLKTK